MSDTSPAQNPMILAQPDTILHAYAEHLLGLRRSNRTGIRPGETYPMRPSAESPCFLLADVSQRETSLEMLQRVYQMRQRWPQVPVGAICQDSIGDKAEAFAAGANQVFTNLDAIEHVFAVMRDAEVNVHIPGRKAQILMGYSVGRDQQALAGELFISAETVKTHTADLYQSFSANSRASLVHHAFAMGILPHASPSPADKFPLSQAETFGMLAVGLTGSQTAAGELLGRSPLTVKTQARNIRQRTGWSVPEAIANVWRYGQQENVPSELLLPA